MQSFSIIVHTFRCSKSIILVQNSLDQSDLLISLIAIIRELFFLHLIFCIKLGILIDLLELTYVRHNSCLTPQNINIQVYYVLDLIVILGPLSQFHFIVNNGYSFFMAYFSWPFPYRNILYTVFFIPILGKILGKFQFAFHF